MLLLWSARKLYLDPLVRLLDAGVDPNVSDAKGDRPLHFVFRSVHHWDLDISKPVVKQLLQSGADPNIQNCDGNTALHLAALKGHPDYTQILINAGAKPWIVNHKGHSPITSVLDHRPMASSAEIMQALESRLNLELC
jgi:ankyrin repeat protein